MNSVKGNLACEGASVAPTTKHDQIANAIAHIDSVVHRLQELSERISGQPLPKDPPPPATQDASLHDVLCGGPAKIGEKVNSCHDIIDDINVLLF